MLLRIQSIPTKKLIGKHLAMSLIDNRTGELWRSFMHQYKEISNAINTDLISMQVYEASYSFEDFDPGAVFEKWAAVEVTDFNRIPDGMETFLLEEGLYAVFLHKGAASTGAKTFQYIFGVWLPESDYVLDNRPHFEVLGKKYKNDDPESEEEIWIPIKAKRKD
ncbi:GyrI-like domain-containing protein [Solitalea longa]|uniref:GyrI-like domain-containing protein n=1 Tax=Solitalea longa TaxID=2079460 RepID=A0A2S5A466_9SPHI|nr:GyrI-like domain-containing protein [Solitalea longa]POY37335.1 GyrI-like domain-containing protein [Solitalea longa]